MRRRAVVLVACSALLGAALVPWARSMVGARGAGTEYVFPQSGTTGPGVTVDPRALPAHSQTTAPGVVPHPRYSSASQAAGSVSTAQPAQVAAATSGPTLLTSFAGLSRDIDVNQFGTNQDLEPPDTQVAAGPAFVVEDVNVVRAIYDRSGNLQGNLIDLTSFYGLSTLGANYVGSDPRILYDSGSGRWFSSLLAFDSSNFNSAVLVAVSSSADPTATWKVYPAAVSTTHVLFDQPKLAITADKVVLTWTDFLNGASPPQGDEQLVVAKADMVSGVATPNKKGSGPFVGRDSTILAARPAQDADALAVVNKSNQTPPNNSNVVGIFTIKGVPPGTVTSTEVDVSFSGTTPPPAATQPGGTYVPPPNDDDRFLSATFNGGALWIAGSDGCTPPGDNKARVCPRLVEITQSGSTFNTPATKDFDFGLKSGSRHYPALAFDGAGNELCVVTQSSGSQNPSVVTFAIDATGAVGPVTTVAAGTAPYHETSSTSRWGDYSAAAVDPLDPNDIWVAGEDALTSSATLNWGTAIGMIIAAPPTVTGVTPPSVPAHQSTNVTITGRDFVGSPITVSFGGVAATNVVVKSATSITATSPASAPGTVDVTVTTPTGTSPTGSADQFTFVGPTPTPTPTPAPTPTPTPTPPPPPPPPPQGYWLVASDGGIFPFGGATGFGSTGGIHLNQPIVGMARTPNGGGYWLVATDGGIFPFGNAGGYGSTGGIHLNQPIVGMAATPTGHGYWLVASDGGIFPFGDAGGYGSTGGIHLNQPIVGMTPTPTGHGYWLVATDGGIFPFGDAGGYGSTGGIHLNQPIVGMAPTPTGHGYWLVATDGGIFPFGDAGGYGSTGGIHLNQPIVGMTRTPDGRGYWLVATDGGIFPFGDAQGLGSTGGTHLNNPIVGMASIG